MKMLLVFVLICTFCLFGCGQEQAVQFNEFQKQILAAEGLPTDPEQLTPYQLTCIQNIDAMMNYLKDKYHEEFIYVGYHEPEEYVSEFIMAYPKARGSGDGKYIVTVKHKKDGSFSDDYYDFSVADYAEQFMTEYLAEHLPADGYKLKITHQTGVIRKDEIENGQFRWKFGGSYCLYIETTDFDLEKVKQFAEKYAKFLHDHQIQSTTRINLMRKIPEDENAFKEENIGTVYDSEDYLGYYSVLVHRERVVNSFWMRYVDHGDGNGTRGREEIPIDEFLAKFS